MDKRVWIGTSGWSYQHWEGVLYPVGTYPRDRFAFYARAFDTVELNASFYRWPRAEAFRSWQRRAPPDFRLSVKAPRGLTHAKRLYQPEPWLRRMERSWSLLANKRAILLAQLSPNFAYDYPRLEYFLQQSASVGNWTIEFRHPSWHREETFQLLEQHGAAYCIMSGAYLPCLLRATASHVYARLHGPDHHHLYSGSYSDDDLRWWADRIREWTGQGRTVYAYFNNDGEGNAVRNASRLKELLA